MNRGHDQIARYIDATMNREERAGFEKRMSVDPALRRQVDAERSIRSTITRDVAALPMEHSATRAAMMSALAALPATPPGGAGGMMPRMAPRPRSPLLRWLGAGGAGAVIVVAGYVLATRAPEQPREPSRATAREISAPPDTSANRYAPSVVDENTTATATPTDTPRLDRDAAHEQTRNPAASGRSAVGTIPPASSPSRDIGDTRVRTTPEAQSPPAERELRVIDRDSVRLRVGVEELRKEP